MPRSPLFAAVVLLLVGTPAAAAPPPPPPRPDYPVTLVAGLGFLAGPTADETGTGTSYGGWGVGRILVHWQNLAVDLGGRAGAASSDLREIGNISAGLRWSPQPAYIRVGFVHHHETPWEIVQEQPVLAAIGSAEGIRHRSGVEMALGFDGAVLPKELPARRLGLWIEGAVEIFPDDNGPPIYGNLDAGLRYKLGKDRAAD